MACTRVGQDRHLPVAPRRRRTTPDSSWLWVRRRTYLSRSCRDLASVSGPRLATARRGFRVLFVYAVVSSAGSLDLVGIDVAPTHPERKCRSPSLDLVSIELLLIDHPGRATTDAPLRVSIS